MSIKSPLNRQFGTQFDSVFDVVKSNPMYDKTGGKMPSLDLNFAKSKSLRDSRSTKNLITFSRASSGTYVDSDGLIKTSPVNLVLNSVTGEIHAATNMTGPTSVYGPGGTDTAFQYLSTGGTVSSRIQFKTVVAATATQYTATVYVKGVNYNRVAFGFAASGFGTNSRRTFYLDTLTTNGVGSGSAAAVSIEDAGNGWRRLRITTNATTSATGITSYIDLGGTGNETHTTDQGFQFYGLQIEEGTTATDYIPTGATISGAPRFDHDPVTGESLGLLIEESRTNIIDRNTSHYNSIWGNAVPSGAYNNAGIAPDGTNTAFATTAYAPAGRGQKNYPMTADTNNYTFSIFIKSTGGQGRYITYLTGFNGGSQDNNNQVAYDFATDTVGSGYSRKLYDNGWVRIWKTYTNTNLTLFLATTGAGTSLDMLFWGAQLEQGSYPSSLIITPDGANVTRSPDIASIEGNKFAKTNLLEYSERFDQSAWAKQQNSGTLPQVTPNVSASPDGSITADRILCSKSGNTYSFVQRSSTYSGNETGSIYLKSNTNSNQTVYFRVGITVSYVTVSTEWQRFSINSTYSGTANFTIGARDSSDDVVDILAWGAQLEEGNELTDYSPSVESFVSRASSATYVDDATGLIKTSPVNYAINSEQVDLWTLNRGSISANFAESPAGDLTADKWIPDTTSNFHYPKLVTTLSSTSSVTYSIYAKQSGYRYLLVNTTAGSALGNAGPVVDLQDGVVVGNFTATYPTTVTDAGNGWWRVAITFAGNGSNIIVDHNPFPTSTVVSYAGDGTSGVLLWGAQLEEGTTATPYIKTGSTISGAARYENGELLLEESRTNYVPFSASTSIFNTIVTTPAPSQGFTSPDGSTDAYQYPINSTNRLQSNRTVPAGQTHTLSFFAKQGDGTNLSGYNGFNVGGQRDNNGNIYNWTTGVLQSGWAKEDYANGWSRFSKSYTSTTGTLFVLQINESYGVLLWGFQLEINASFPTSYIPTTSSTVTRAADVSTSALGVDSWYNQSEGTVFADAKNYPHPLTGKALVPFAFSDNSYSNRITLAGSTGNDQFNFDVTVGSTMQRTILGNFVSSRLKASGGYKSTGSAGSLDGAAAVTSNTPNIPSVISQLDIGRPHDGQNIINGHISRFAYFPTRLPDNKLKFITSKPNPYRQSIVYNITNSGGTFNLRSSGTVNYSVGWNNDESYEESTSNTLSNTYSAGNHFVRVYSNDVYRPYFNNVTADASQITSVAIGSGADLGTDLTYAWYGANNMTSFDCPFDVTSSVAYFTQGFRDTALSSFPLIDTSSVIETSSMFNNVTELTTLPLLDFSSVITGRYSLAGCSGITSLPAFNLSSAGNLQGFASNATSLASLPAFTFTSTLGRIDQGFQGCSSLADVPANLFDNCIGLGGIAFNNTFSNCALTAQSIENILTSLDTNGATGITLGINGHTNAGKTTWSAAAVTAYDNLIVKGWTISFNA